VTYTEGNIGTDGDYCVNLIRLSSNLLSGELNIKQRKTSAKLSSGSRCICVQSYRTETSNVI